MESHIVTKGWLDKYRTKRGAWTRSQLDLLGVRWPPPPKWRDKLEGTSIPVHAARMFESEAYNPNYAKSTLKRHGEKNGAQGQKQSTNHPVNKKEKKLLSRIQSLEASNAVLERRLGNLERAMQSLLEGQEEQEDLGVPWE